MQLVSWLVSWLVSYLVSHVLYMSRLVLTVTRIVSKPRLEGYFSLSQRCCCSTRTLTLKIVSLGSFETSALSLSCQSPLLAISELA
jgi:hypothetical protein